jgi:hypothetical protein
MILGSKSVDRIPRGLQIELKIGWKIVSHRLAFPVFILVGLVGDESSSLK